MEYLPYKQVEGNPRIQIFPNEYHGLLMFSNVEEGKIFLLKQAKDFIAYEESGKNVENCVYTTSDIQENIYTIKEGFFIEEVDDGYFLYKKSYSGLFYNTPYPERVHSYFLSPLVRKTKKPSTPRERALPSGKEEIIIHKHDSLVQEMKTLFSSGEEILKPTGIKARLIAKDKVYSSESNESSDQTEEYTSQNSDDDDTLKELDAILDKIREGEIVPELEEMLFPDSEENFLPQPKLEEEDTLLKQWSFEEYSSDSDDEEYQPKEPKLHLSW